jgi:hypothetical protein
MVGTALSCAPTGQPVAPSSAARESVLDRHTLVLAALDCMTAPLVYDTPPWAASDPEMDSYGPDTSSCTTAGRAIGVRPARLYRMSPDVLFDLRHEIARSPAGLQPPGSSTDLLSFFDQSVAAILEARRAQAALVGEPLQASPEAVGKIRAGQMVARLDEFGQRAGASGLEARAVAMLIAANRFRQIARVPAEVRPYVAEPLFSMMFGSEFRSEPPSEPPASWTNYLAAAAHAVSRRPSFRVAERLDEPADARRPAMGGGPRDARVGDLGVVSRAVAADVSSLATAVAPGRLRFALERTVDRLAMLDVDRAASTP